MRLISLGLRNVYQHDDLTLNLEFGTTGITGINGAGKSNMVDGALYFAITGKTCEGTNKSDMLNWHASTGHTELLFSHDADIYKLVRNLHNSTAKLTCPDDSEFKPRTNKEANEFVEDALGMSFAMFYESCWVPQGTLTSILTMSHSQRMSFFQRLADTRKAETIRGVLQDSLNNLPNYIDRSTDIENLAEGIRLLEDEIIPQSQKAIDDYTGSKGEYDKLMGTVEVTLKTKSEVDYNTGVNTALNDLSDAQETVATFKSVNNLEEDKTHVPPISTEEEMAKDRYTKYLRYKEDYDKANKQIQELAVPEEVEVDEGLSQAASKARLRVQKGQETYKMAKDQVCPTCRRAFEFEGGEEERGQIIASFEKELAEHKDLQKRDDKNREEVMTYANAQDKYRTRKKDLDIDLAAAEEQMVKYEGHGHDPEVYITRTNECKEYTDWLKRLREKQDKLRTLELAVTRAEVNLKTAKEQVYVTAEDAESAKEFKESYEELVECLQRAGNTHAAAKARLDANKTQHATYVEEQELRAKIHSASILLKRAREVLHRDQLPKLVMRKMLYGLNALLDNYLGLFTTPFTAFINEDFDFMVSFAGTDPKPAKVLSGGQKVALSIAFRFAISDLNSSSVPLLVLDEPTNHLDEENVQKVGEVLDKAREMTEDGVIVLIATHEESLHPHFTRVVNVDDLTA